MAFSQFYIAQIQAAETDARADNAAASIIAEARLNASTVISQANVAVATDQATVDVTADGLRVGGEAYQIQESVAGEVSGTSIVASARTGAAQQLDAARTAAAQSVADARIAAAYQVASARIAAVQATTAADVAAAQSVADARIAAARVTAAADVEAAQLSSTARLQALGVDWATRLDTAGILIAARVAAAQTEANAQVSYDQAVAAAEIAANQAEADARLAGESSVADAHVAAALLLADARVAAASTEADAEIAVATTEAAAAYAAAQTETDAQVTIIGLDPSNQVADLELEATTYAANQDLAAREFAATAAYDAGVFAAAQSYAGSVYRAARQLVGVQYGSDRDTAATEIVAATRAAADEYIATDQYDGVVYASEAQRSRFEQKLAFAESLFVEIWPVVSQSLGPPATTVQTPGYATPPPAIGTPEVVDAPTRAAIVAAICGEAVEEEAAATSQPVAPAPLRFYLPSSTDHTSPSSGTPTTLLLWDPGVGSWFAPAGALVSNGSGYWTISPAASDQSGGLPLLIYAAASDSDPTPAWAAGSDAIAQGDTLQPLPFWMGTTASFGYSPAAGLSPQVSLSPPGSTRLGQVFQAGQGRVSEVGHGWYLYWPTPSDAQDAGLLSMLAVASGAEDWAWTYTIAAPAVAVATSPSGTGLVPATAASEAAAVAARLAALGVPASGPLAGLAASWLPLDGLMAATDGPVAFGLGLAAINAQQLLAAQSAEADQFARVNRVAITAEVNQITKGLGLLATIPRLVTVSPGG